MVGVGFNHLPALFHLCGGLGRQAVGPWMEEEERREAQRVQAAWAESELPFKGSKAQRLGAPRAGRSWQGPSGAPLPHGCCGRHTFALEPHMGRVGRVRAATYREARQAHLARLPFGSRRPSLSWVSFSSFGTLRATRTRGWWNSAGTLPSPTPEGPQSLSWQGQTPTPTPTSSSWVPASGPGGECTEGPG